MIQNYVPRATIWWEHAIVKHVKSWHAEHGYGGTVSVGCVHGCEFVALGCECVITLCLYASVRAATLV